MTKTELIAKIAQEAELTKVQSEKALNIFLATLVDEIKTSGSIALSGLGSFNVVKRAARTGHNPRTLATIQIPASNTVKFKCAKVLKDAVNS